MRILMADGRLWFCFLWALLFRLQQPVQIFSMETRLSAFLALLGRNVRFTKCL